MAVYNYKLLSTDITLDICADITSHEEQGWEFISFNSGIDIQEGYSSGFSHTALMRKPK